MKITNERRAVTDKPDRLPKGKNGPGASSFSGLLKNVENNIRMQELDGLIEKIEQQGKALIRSRTMQEFRLFKQYVQQFIRQAVTGGLEVDRTYDWHGAAGARAMKRVRAVDEKLMEIADALLLKENAAVELLQRIGELKGLLVNLYR